MRKIDIYRAKNFLIRILLDTFQLKNFDKMPKNNKIQNFKTY